MFFLSYIIAVFAVFCLVFAGLILLKLSRDTRAFYLALLTACAGIWALGNAEADVAASGIEIMGWTMAATFGFVFFATFFLCFVASLKRRGNLPWYILFLLCAPGTSIFVLLFNPLTLGQTIFDPLVLGYAPSVVSFGPLYSLSALVIHVLFAFGIGALLIYRRKVSLENRLQITYITIGASAALIGSAVFDVLLPLIGVNNLYNIGPLSTGLMIGCLSYAIIRHHLLDIRVVVQKSTIYTLLLAISIVAYYVTLGGLWLILGPHSILAAPLSAGLIMIVGIFTLPVLEKYFRKITDSIFFKDRYDYAEALQNLSQSLEKSVEIGDVVALCQQGLSKVLKARSVTVLPTAATPVPAEVIIPIIHEGRPLGTIFLEEKLSGDLYTAEDMQLLRTFAHQVSIAFGRALLYDQVKQHAAELEKKVRERTEELKRTQEDQKQMMLDVSHALQTPLAVIQTKIEQLKKTTPFDGELHQFETSLANVSNFIYSLLRLAYLENNKEKFELSPMHLSSLLIDITEEVKTIATARNISVRQNIAPDVYIKGDAEKIREVVMNLASNSVKYMRPSGAKEIIFSLSTEEGVASVSISDTGVGIAEEDIPFIFERFYRVRRSTENIHGSGLGLAISKHIVTEHGGTLAVKSELNNGTTITICFPFTD